MTTVFFGLLHWGQGLFGIAATAALGGLLLAIVLWRKYLWAATLAHALYHAIAMSFV